jgi:hypothetical protein
MHHNNSHSHDEDDDGYDNGQIQHDRRHQSVGPGGSPSHSVGGRSRGGSLRRRRGRMLRRHRSSGALTHTGNNHGALLLSMQSPSFRSVRSPTHEVLSNDENAGGDGRNARQSGTYGID